MSSYAGDDDDDESSSYEANVKYATGDETDAPVDRDDYELSVEDMDVRLVQRLFAAEDGDHTIEHLLHDTTVAFVDATVVDAPPRPIEPPTMGKWTPANGAFLDMPHNSDGVRLTSVAYGKHTDGSMCFPTPVQSPYVGGASYVSEASRRAGKEGLVRRCTEKDTSTAPESDGSVWGDAPVDVRKALVPEGGMFYSQYITNRDDRATEFRLHGVMAGERAYLQMWPLSAGGHEVVSFSACDSGCPLMWRMHGVRAPAENNMYTMASFERVASPNGAALKTSIHRGLYIGDYRVRNAERRNIYMMTGPAVNNDVASCENVSPGVDLCADEVPEERSTWAVHVTRVGRNLKRAYLDLLYASSSAGATPAVVGAAKAGGGGMWRTLLDCCARTFGGERRARLDGGGEAECVARGYGSTGTRCNALMTDYCASEEGKKDPVCGCAPTYPAIASLPATTMADAAIRANPQCFNTPSCNGAPRAFRFESQLWGDGSTYCPPQVFCEASVGATDDSLISNIHISQCNNPDAIVEKKVANERKTTTSFVPGADGRRGGSGGGGGRDSRSLSSNGGRGGRSGESGGGGGADMTTETKIALAVFAVGTACTVIAAVQGVVPPYMVPLVALVLGVGVVVIHKPDVLTKVMTSNS